MNSELENWRAFNLDPKLVVTLLYRNKIGETSFPTKEIKTILEKVISPLKKKVLADLQSLLPEAKEWIVSTSQKEKKSLPFLCSYFLCELYTKITSELSPKGKKAFAILFDFNLGIMMASTTIPLAEDWLGGTMNEKELSSIFSDWAEITKGSPTESAEAYLQEKSQLSHLTELLISDPTGSSVIQGYAAWLKEQRNSFFPYNQDLVVAGAEFGKELYEILYHACT